MGNGENRRYSSGFRVNPKPRLELGLGGPGLAFETWGHAEDPGIYFFGFQQWANSFRIWLVPMTLKERVCFE